MSRQEGERLQIAQVGKAREVQASRRRRLRRELKSEFGSPIFFLTMLDCPPSIMTRSLTLLLVYGLQGPALR